MLVPKAANLASTLRSLLVFRPERIGELKFQIVYGDR